MMCHTTCVPANAALMVQTSFPYIFLSNTCLLYSTSLGLSTLPHWMSDTVMDEDTLASLAPPAEVY